jgi:putative addiction module component (TIGR02574 family)
MSSLLSAFGLEGLSVEQRLRLIEELSESLDAEAGRLPLTEAQSRELGRRLAALDASPEAVVSWEDAEARALARLKR